MTFSDQPVARAWPALLWQVPVALALGLLAVFVVGIERPELVGFLYLAAVTAALCRSDLAEHRLPNVLVLPGFVVTALGLLVAAVRSGAVPIVPLVAGAAAFGFLLLLNLGGGMGMGDVKLGALLALNLGCLGAGAAITGPALGFVFGGVAGLFALLIPAAGVVRQIPFGPFLLLGAWSAVAFQLVDPNRLG
jgi:leader peptidase (prepilin peptidase)/N-methyltransferase